MDTKTYLSHFVFTLLRTTINLMKNQEPVVELSTNLVEYIVLIEGMKEGV